MSTWIARGALGVALLGLTALTTGCQTATKAYADVFLRGKTITYDEYLSQDSRAIPPVTVDALIDALGPPSDVYDRDGIRRRVDYHAFSLTGELKRAEFHFDRDERLTKKELW